MEIKNNICSIVSDLSGEIFNRTLGNRTWNYAHSKATTPFQLLGSTNTNGHYLFAQRRSNGVSSFYIDRFIVDGSRTISLDISSPQQGDNWWGNNGNNPITGSPMEFSPNGMLAVLIRNVASGGSIYTIDQDLSSFTRVVIQNLLVEPDPTHAGLAIPYIVNNIGGSRSPGGYLSINNLSPGPTM